LEIVLCKSLYFRSGRRKSQGPNTIPENQTLKIEENKSNGSSDDVAVVNGTLDSVDSGVTSGNISFCRNEVTVGQYQVFKALILEIKSAYILYIFLPSVYRKKKTWASNRNTGQCVQSGFSSRLLETSITSPKDSNFFF